MDSISIHRNKKNNQRGVTLVDTALLVALLFVVCVVGVRRMGRHAADKFCQVHQGMSNNVATTIELNQYHFDPDPEVGDCVAT